MGFTLVELSIVIVIIGLIVAGVVAGQSLVKQAKIRSIVTSSDILKTAINSFKLQYNALPGDMNNAASYWPSSGSGDGNGKFCWSNNTAGAGASEVSRAFEHLGLSGFLPGSYRSSSDSTLNGVGYKTGLKDGKMFVTSWTKEGASPCTGDNPSAWRDIYEKGKVILMYGKPISTATSTEVNAEIFTPTEAYNIDNKYDDGILSTGAIFGANSISNRNTNSGKCGNFTVTPYVYDLTNPNTVSCTIGFSL